MILITGDMHGTHDIHKFSTDNFPLQKELNRTDYVIICGDFGLLWDGSDEDEYWLDWLDNKPWTTLWIDGNHENFDMLADYPVEEWRGGQVQYIRDNILHLCRGSVFSLEGKKIFAFGGAESHDKKYRTYGRSIWKEELPNAQEMEHGRQSLDAVNWEVDIVITHSLPETIQDVIFFGWEYGTNDLTNYFDEIDKRLDFRLWFSGHYHHSMAYDSKHFLIYNNIVRLTDSGFERVYPIPWEGEDAANKLLDIK